ncbi:MAG: MarR family transcriptional regulator [Coriobacteriales bacterium]|nr:MarR family transcriptional regulator [Coriobacteriales bacterium]
MALYATTDMMTTVIGFVDAVRRMLRAECGISVAEYRLLAYLSDREEPIRPAVATRVLDASPAMTTFTTNGLVRKGLARRLDAKGGPVLVATPQGVALCRDADSALEQVHHALLSLLSEKLRNTIVVGTQMTVMAVTKVNRMKGGTFYGEFETLQAFLIIEKVMTESAQAFGLSMNGFRILFRLGEVDGGATPGELAETLAVPPSAITYAVKALEQEGLVTRFAEKLDKRSVRVRITQAGADLLQRSSQHMDPRLISGIRGATASERRFIQEACEFIAIAVRKWMRQG